MITFRINTDSGVPPYLQLVQQVKQSLQMGILREGDRLPTVREVVGMITINPNTVAKAYQVLEQQGIVKGQAGVGTTVIKRPHGPSPETQVSLGKSLNRWIILAHKTGMDNAAIESLFRAVINQGGDNGTNHNN